MTVADGHGPEGDEAALYACDCGKRLPCPSGRSLALNHHEHIVQSIRNAMAQMIHSAPHNKSGATLTHIMFVEYDARRWVITTNVGDSEALIVYKNSVHVCSVPHNWDNFSVYKRYANVCLDPKPVCYNRWNAGKHKLKDPHGEYKPIMLYDRDDNNDICIHEENVAFMEKLHIRKRRPDLKFGTQSKRIPSQAHENWGSTVIVDGRAQGQVMASVGDHNERSKTGVPYDMVHVYIHEVPIGQHIAVVTHTDGVTNERTLDECGLEAWSKRDAQDYLENIISPKDDMACCIAHWGPNPKDDSISKDCMHLIHTGHFCAAKEMVQYHVPNWLLWHCWRLLFLKYNVVHTQLQYTIHTKKQKMVSIETHMGNDAHI